MIRLWRCMCNLRKIYISGDSTEESKHVRQENEKQKPDFVPRIGINVTFTVPFFTSLLPCILYC